MVIRSPDEGRHGMTEATAPVWGDAPTLSLPRLEHDERADVCVVGLGATGLSAVEHLLGAGARVVAVDGGTVGGGSSGRNGGLLLAGLATFHHDAAATLGRERAARLYRLTLEELDRTARRFPAIVRRHGSLRVAESTAEQDDCHEQLAAMRRDDLPVSLYHGPQGVGLRFPLDAAFDPRRRCRLQAEATVRRGARLYERTPATRIRGCEVSTPTGSVRCSAVVVCVDGGLEALLPELSGRVRTARAQVLATAAEPDVRIATPVYARWGYDYWQQLPDGRIALGGGRDVGGAGEWTVEAVPSDAVQAHLEARLVELGVRAPVTHRWAGLIGFSNGALPLYTEPRPGVVAVGGYRGTGNLIGPLWGRAAARRALDGDDGFGDLLTAPSVMGS